MISHQYRSIYASRITPIPNPDDESLVTCNRCGRIRQVPLRRRQGKSREEIRMCSDCRDVETPGWRNSGIKKGK